MSLEDVYTAEWFKHFDGLREEFKFVAATIHRQFRPSTVIDIGCGPGMIIENLPKYGVTKVHGVEGSIHGINFASSSIRDCIEHQDILHMRESFPWEGSPHIPWDVIICTEVAEHLSADDAPQLTRLLASYRSPVIVFTAAPPGQGGHDHQNEQPMGYWEDLFLKQGVIPNDKATADLKERWLPLEKLAHMQRNVRVFR